MQFAVDLLAPDGRTVTFLSDRGGEGLAVWSRPADGTRQGLLGAPTFEQDGHEATMIQLADFDGKQPIETPVVIVENVLAFTDMMNTDFPFTGVVKGNVITITPDTDRILAAWPDWVKPPSRKNLDKCRVTLTRKR